MGPTGVVEKFLCVWFLTLPSCSLQYSLSLIQCWVHGSLVRSAVSLRPHEWLFNEQWTGTACPSPGSWTDGADLNWTLGEARLSLWAAGRSGFICVMTACVNMLSVVSPHALGLFVIVCVWVCVCVWVGSLSSSQSYFLWGGGDLNKEALSCPAKPAGWKLLPACHPAVWGPPEYCLFDKFVTKTVPVKVLSWGVWRPADILLCVLGFFCQHRKQRRSRWSCFGSL